MDIVNLNNPEIMTKIKVKNIDCSEYDGMAEFYLVDKVPKKDTFYRAHYFSDPQADDTPAKKGEIKKGKISIDALGKCKKRKKGTKLGMEQVSDYSNLIKTICKVKSFLSDKLLLGQTNVMKNAIEIKFDEPVKNIKQDDIIEVLGGLELDFAKD